MTKEQSLHAAITLATAQLLVCHLDEMISLPAFQGKAKSAAKTCVKIVHEAIQIEYSRKDSNGEDLIHYESVNEQVLQNGNFINSALKLNEKIKKLSTAKQKHFISKYNKIIMEFHLGE
jgi:hypothetical protein